ncbi:hypothetical protein [Bacillus nakamurai]|uniref:hypothetical protein n=1 Tax=Bacillus nakamurai TaxID=1793963 RepID=UPI000ABE34BA|nr:hypothetical protein [Bacillus nakamurai]MCC9023602.1 hypothetical protein [Bacillus nakamurai]
MNEIVMFDWMNKNKAPFAFKLKVMELLQLNTLLVNMDKELMEKEIIMMRRNAIGS